MRALDQAFAAHLSTGATTLCHCWRVARRDGAVLGFTDHDRKLSFGGDDYEPSTGADGAAIASTADLAVDNSEIEGLLSSQRLAAAELLGGRFDGAAVEIWRVNWAAPEERLLIKRGGIGEVRREGRRFVAEIRGASAALDEVRGRVYQRFCDANVGDRRCRADLERPAYKGQGAVAEILDGQRFRASGLTAFAAGWFANGRLDWTSGANAGTSAHVKAHGADQSLALWRPAGAPIAAGDAFEARAGCDKAFATCREKFSNVVNFRGFHLMPGNDFIIQIAAPGGPNDGGRR